jgi:hypothetical protein
MKKPLTRPIHEAQRQKQGRRAGPAVVQHLQIPGDRHRHDGDGREIDAAADDHHRHADGEDAEHADAAHDGDQIVDGEEAGKSHACCHEQQDRQREHDALLAHVPDREERFHLPPLAFGPPF